ncbi:DUF159-domain-containing protein [Decorospora gaudefroyi]|uniref:DUF159-domain-containing protein n=1 Tax=Decorospora gaudefroyi TaxID=184978 RepID=A0A6A5K2A5_9PLEO|nr:DUF159-domain-containing protein [Decorospora gaudefroyi]
MCGRYALALRPSQVRQQLEQSQMPVAEAPDDDSDVRQSYNFAPGYHGLVYRADGPDTGGQQDGKTESEAQLTTEGATGGTKYKLQSMQWGLVPFWTKRNPDYGSKMKTINCRDDSLFEDRGMWTTMKKKKRCIIVAQGFYEWLKKNGGKEKIPHFTKRKDGQLMCLAGLWDCVQFEDASEKLFTYTIITTDSNKQLNFLHDRMPVILDNGSDDIRTWLDPTRTKWSKDLQSLLRPYEGELECYPVSKDVGKVGNNSPSFLVKPPKAKGIPNKHLHARSTFLYHAATYLTLPIMTPDSHASSGVTQGEKQPKPSSHSPLALQLGSDLQQVSRKGQLRLAVDLKRSMCKSCNTILIPGRTATQNMENQSRDGKKPWADVLVVTCNLCAGKKRFPVGASKQLEKAKRKAAL